MNEMLAAAAQKAYETLLDAGIEELPVSVEKLISALPQVSLLTFGQAAALLEISPEALAWDFPSQEAFTLSEIREGRTRHLICYQEKTTPSRRRFALAHELGHVLLEHAREGGTEDAQVNCFAEHLLCPRPFLRQIIGARPKCAEDLLMRVTGLSSPMLKRIMASPAPEGIGDDIQRRLSAQLKYLPMIPEPEHHSFILIHPRF